MKKVLYIANFLYREDSGATSVARTHLCVLEKGYGEKNVFAIALVGVTKPTYKLRKERFEICSVENNVIKRGFNLIRGNTGKINSEIIRYIGNYIENNSIQIVFWDDSIYGLAIKNIKQKFPNVHFAAYYHDVKRNLCIEWIKKRIIDTPKYIPLLINEKYTAKFADTNIVLNKREADLYKKYYKKEADILLPVILPNQNNFNFMKKMDRPLRILFVGGYYYPNVNGIDWFIKNVLSRTDQLCNLTIVGNQMDKLINVYKDVKNVVAHGRVEDLTPYYVEADVVVGPIFEGAGMKVKTAEAFSFGKLFVGTDESLEGYKEYLTDELLNKFIFVANNEMDFISAIFQIINSDNVKKSNKAVLEFFEKHYSIQAAADLLVKKLV